MKTGPKVLVSGVAMIVISIIGTVLSILFLLDSAVDISLSFNMETLNALIHASGALIIMSVFLSVTGVIVFILGIFITLINYFRKQKRR